ncbi:MAG: Phosphohydrolase (MutT/nudix family protein), partial [uncultured Craurococcus sp.]
DHLLHRRHAFRPWRRPRPLPPPLRLHRRDGRGDDRALERDHRPRGRGLASRRRRHRPEARGAGRPPRPPAWPQASRHRQQRRPRDPRLARLGQRPALCRAGARRPQPRPLPLRLPHLAQHASRLDQPARPQPWPPQAPAAPGRCRRRCLGLPPRHPRRGRCPPHGTIETNTEAFV